MSTSVEVEEQVGEPFNFDLLSKTIEEAVEELKKP